MRLNKYIARCGICSRRKADELIKAGLITINGQVTQDLSYQVTNDDKVKYQGKILEISNTELYAFHKPKGCLTSKTDPEGRKTIYDVLPKKLQNFSPIGRLDLNSEGLLLLTNDGELKRKFELPKNQLPRTYKVRVFGKLSSNDKKLVESGISIDGIQYRPAKINIIKPGVNSWLEITLTEGKNREIRKIFEYLGYPVSRLIRISYGNHDLGSLAAGETKIILNVEF